MINAASKNDPILLLREYSGIGGGLTEEGGSVELDELTVLVSEFSSTESCVATTATDDVVDCSVVFVLLELLCRLLFDQKRVPNLKRGILLQSGDS